MHLFHGYKKIKEKILTGREKYIKMVCLCTMTKQWQKTQFSGA